MAIVVDRVNTCYKKRGLDALEKFINDMELSTIFENIFAGYDDSKTVCTLRFISKDEMKNHESKVDYTTRDICIDLIKHLIMMIATGDKVCKCINEINPLLNRLLEALIVDKHDMNDHSADEVKKRIEELEKAITSLKNCKCSCPATKENILEKLDELMEKLNTLQFPMHDLLGCYWGEKDVIFICIDNIKKECAKNFKPATVDKNKDKIIGLLCSVIVHEYAHFVDANTKLHRSPRNKKEKVLYSGLQETIAETIQKLYIDQYIEEKWKSQDLQNWIINHSTSGRFPGWGYAGANILGKAEYKNRNLKYFVVEVINISRKDWRVGYEFIDWLKHLENI